jgi:hypothetical protein
MLNLLCVPELWCIPGLQARQLSMKSSLAELNLTASDTLVRCSLDPTNLQCLYAALADSASTQQSPGMPHNTEYTE